MFYNIILPDTILKAINIAITVCANMLATINLPAGYLVNHYCH